jgi:hypothetical protein
MHADISRPQVLRVIDLLDHRYCSRLICLCYKKINPVHNRFLAAIVGNPLAGILEVRRMTVLLHPADQKSLDSLHGVDAVVDLILKPDLIIHEKSDIRGITIHTILLRQNPDVVLIVKSFLSINC